MNKVQRRAPEHSVSPIIIILLSIGDISVLSMCNRCFHVFDNAAIVVHAIFSYDNLAGPSIDQVDESKQSGFTS